MILALFAHVRIESPRAVVIRQLLTLATAKEGLGFSRALYLERQEDQLRCRACIGSINAERFGVIATIANSLGLQALLDKSTGGIAMNLRLSGELTPPRSQKHSRADFPLRPNSPSSRSQVSKNVRGSR